MIQTVTIVNNISVINQVSNLYQSLDYIFDFLALNPTLNLLEIIQAGKTVYYDLSVITPNPVKVTNQTVSANTTFNVTGQYNQSIFDIITRYYGNLNYIAKYLSDNPNIYEVTEYAEENIYTVTPNLTTNVQNFNILNNVFATYQFKKGKTFNQSFRFRSFD